MEYQFLKENEVIALNDEFNAYPWFWFRTCRAGQKVNSVEANLGSYRRPISSTSQVSHKDHV